MQSYRLEEDIKGLIYSQPLKRDPTRYQMVRYSTWRIYFYQELESMAPEKVKDLRTCFSWIEKYPNLVANNEEKMFYESLFQSKKEQIFNQDIISHFTCRMLYCRDIANHQKFIDMERQVLSIKLHRRILKDSQNSMKEGMKLLKHLLAFFLKKSVSQFNVTPEIWQIYKTKIIQKDIKFKYNSIDGYATVPLEYGQVGMRKRMSFVKKGYVYMNIQNTIMLVLNLYCSFLRQKLTKMRVAVVDLINNDVENQITGFITKTIQTMNSSNFDQTLVKNQFKLTGKNIQSLWKKFYPPCMMYLTQKLKQNNHLKHDGRRQLWLFLKGCGMTVQDNKEYFHNYLAKKVSASDLKSHLYNIEHAYGLVGHKQHERPKNCRNIITGPVPKKDQYHGCPFSHWSNDHLLDYLRDTYHLSQEHLKEVMKEKNQNHFQVACGRLFEELAKRNSDIKSIPSEVTNKLGRSPHQYFQAGLELYNRNLSF